MRVHEVTVQVRVLDFARGRAWYEGLLDRPPDFVHHEDFAEWQLVPGVWLQVGQGEPACGSGPLRLGVDNLELERDRVIARLGVPRFEMHQRPEVPVRWATFEDPWGNRVGCFQPLAPEPSEMAPMLRQVSIHVTNLDQGVAFYERALGLGVRRWLAPLAVPMAHGGCSLFLHLAERAHAGTRLDDCRVTRSFPTEDMRRSLTRLKVAGRDLLTPEPRPSPFGDWVAFRDPFGNVMELVACSQDADGQGGRVE